MEHSKLVVNFGVGEFRARNLRTRNPTKAGIILANSETLYVLDAFALKTTRSSITRTITIAKTSGPL